MSLEVEGTWTIVKGIFNWVIYPLVGLIGYLFTSYVKKYDQVIASLSTDVADLKTKQAVTSSQISDIREDLRNLTQAVKDAENHISRDIMSLQRDIKGINYNGS